MNTIKAKAQAPSPDGRNRHDLTERSDMLTERDKPGLHGGSGSPKESRRPKNREVENEMLKDAGSGKSPKPATEPSKP